MNPLSALIGGAASLFGGLMNSSSTQAINAANLQQQMNMAQGAYLPGLVANAQKAGINPLAVMGVHAPTGGTAVPIGQGEGLRGLGNAIAQMNPYGEELQKLDVDRSKAQNELLRTQISNASIEAARNKWSLGQLMSNPKLLGPGVQESSIQTGFGIPQIEWMKDLIKGYDRPVRPSYPTGGPSDLSGYLDWIFGGR